MLYWLRVWEISVNHFSPTTNWKSRPVFTTSNELIFVGAQEAYTVRALCMAARQPGVVEKLQIEKKPSLVTRSTLRKY